MILINKIEDADAARQFCSDVGNAIKVQPTHLPVINTEERADMLTDFLLSSYYEECWLDAESTTTKNLSYLSWVWRNGTTPHPSG